MCYLSSFSCQPLRLAAIEGSWRPSEADLPVLLSAAEPTSIKPVPRRHISSSNFAFYLLVPEKHSP